MLRLGLTAFLVALTATGCKGKTTYKDSPETTQKLSDCEKALKEKQTYITTLEKRLLDGEGTAVTVNIQGEAMKISGKGPHEITDGEAGNADDAKLYEAFIAALRR